MKSLLDNSSLIQNREPVLFCRRLFPKSKFIPCVFRNLIIFNLLIFNLYTQQPTLEWAARYERPITSGILENFMALDKLGNVYVLGRIYSTATLADMVLIKYNSAGDTVWTRIYNHISNNDDEPHGLAVDSIGNAYVTGQTGPNSGAGDIITLKYSPTGALLWAKISAATPTSNITPAMAIPMVFFDLMLP